MLSSYAREGLVRYKEKFLHGNSDQALKQTSQGSGGITILEEFRKCVDMASEDMV